MIISHLRHSDLALVLLQLDPRTEPERPLGLAVAGPVLQTLRGGVELEVWPVVGGGQAELGLVRSLGGQNHHWVLRGGSRN